MAMAGEPGGPPVKAGISYVDHSGGLAAALAVCAALVERGRTGAGRHVDLGLLDVQVSMLSYLAAWGLTAGYVPERFSGGAHPSLVPAQVFATADGWVSIFVGNDGLWAKLVAAIGDERLAGPELATGAGPTARPRDGGRGAGRGSRAAHDESVGRAARAGRRPASPVNDLTEALAEPQVVERGLAARADHPAYGEYGHVDRAAAELAGRAALAGADARRAHARAARGDRLRRLLRRPADRRGSGRWLRRS